VRNLCYPLRGTLSKAGLVLPVFKTRDMQAGNKKGGYGMVWYGYRGIAAHPLSVGLILLGVWLWREPLARLAWKSFSTPALRRSKRLCAPMVKEQ
jgi:hypothetical protein